MSRILPGRRENHRRRGTRSRQPQRRPQADVKQLQYWLGHSDIQTTLNIYAHYDRQRLEDVGNDMNQISQKVAGLFDL